MNEQKKRTMLSGVKPSGIFHLGNYFGAVRQFVALQEQFETVYVFVANYHALNSVKDPQKLQQYTHELVAAYLAVGLDPERVVFFLQSDVSAHTELAWIFNTLMPLGYLKRAHVYKDAKAKGKENELSVGDFTYPILMAADILLYDADVVPVGKDQKQHLEMARDIAERFNHTYGETFTLPEPYILQEVQTIPGIDGRKMSKSYGNVIPFFADSDTLHKLVMRIVTDSEGEFPENVYAIHRLIKPEEELQELYQANKGQYKVLKEALFADLDAFLAPYRTRYQELLADPEQLQEILARGAEQAQAVAARKMQTVKQRIGVL